MDRKEALEKGLTVYCLACKAAYPEVPTTFYEDGHGGRPVPACTRCGSDLFAKLSDDTPATT